MSVTLEADEDEPTPGLLPNGRPDPGYAAALGLVAAPLGRRATAFAIDVAIVVVLAIPALIAMQSLMRAAAGGAANLLSSPGALGNLIVLAASELLINLVIIGQLILHGRKGFTIGKRAVGIRSVNAIRFDRPGFWWMVLRGLVLQCSAFIVPIIGAVVMLGSPLVDPQARGRGWLDFVGRNWLIDVKNGLDPYDVKALRHARKRVEAPEQPEDVGLPSLATGAGARTADQQRSPLFAPGSRSHSAIVGGPQLAAGAPSFVQSEAPASAPTPPPAPASPIAAPLPPVVPAAPIRQATANQPPPTQRTSSDAPTHPSATRAPQTRPTPAADASPSANVPVQQPAVQQAAMPEQHAAVMVFDDGSQFDTGAGGVIGRNPDAGPDGSGQVAIAVSDDSMSISKTHAAFGSDARGIWIIDKGSRNGTAIRSADGTSRQVTATERSYLQPGDTVFVGQRSFVVKPA